jgi:predicted nucleic acid-binding protein
MILYLDASALVKRYVAEPGSVEVNEAISRAEVIGTALISRAAVAAALGKAMRLGVLTPEDAWASLQVFREEWPYLVQVQVTETLIGRADTFAWEHSLRGYDAVHLAAASLWQEAMSERVTLSTFDRGLWAAAERVGLLPYPADLPALLDAWKE